MKYKELLKELSELTPEQLEYDCLVHDPYGDNDHLVSGLSVLPEEGDEPEEVIIYILK
jgi:hypothetical protein